MIGVRQGRKRVTHEPSYPPQIETIKSKKQWTEQHKNRQKKSNGKETLETKSETAVISAIGLNFQ